MRQFLAVAGLALSLATPAFAQVSPDYPVTAPLSSTPRIRAEQEWWRLVARANAYRLGQQQQQAVPPQRAEINSGASASDAATGMEGVSTPPAQNAQPSGCPGNNEADQNWRPGEYCLPGGR